VIFRLAISLHSRMCGCERLAPIRARVSRWLRCKSTFAASRTENLWSIGAYLTALRCYIKLGRCPLVVFYLESFLIGAVPRLCAA
jgi:hypothetical protein